MSRWSHRSRIWALLPLLPVAALYLPVLGYPFVDLDDHYFVVSNPAIRDLSWEGVRHLFLEDQRDFRYFPTTYLSFAVDHHLFGLDPGYFHLTNVLLHLANTAMVFLLLGALSRDAPTAALAALLFGIHPLQVESVAWVMGRKNVLFLFFFLLSSLSYLRYATRRTERPLAALAALAASLVLFALAATAKTAAVTLPAALLLVDLHLAARRGETGRGALALLWRNLPSKLPYLPVILLVHLQTRALAQRSPFVTEYAFSALDWAVIAGHNLFFYLYKTLLPIRLGAFYPLPDAGAAWLPLRFYVFAALSAALLAAWLRSFGRRPLVFFGLGWYFVTILPMAILPFFFSDIPLLAADRFFYQSSIGVFLLLAAGFAALWRRAPPGRRALARAALAIGLAALLGVLFAAAARQRETWRSTIALYEQVVRHHPSDAFYYRLALEYDFEGEREKAFRALEEAEAAPQQIFFGRVFSYQMRLSDLYRRKGDMRKAAAFLERAIESTPNAFEPADARTPLAYRYLADLYERAGESARAAAARAAARTARVDPSSYFESFWFAQAPEVALPFLQRRVSEAPRDAVAWYYLGMFYRLAGASGPAEDALRRADELGFSF